MIDAKAIWCSFVVCLGGSVAMPGAPLAAQTMPSQAIPRGARIRISLKASPEKLLVGTADTLKNDGLSWRPAVGSSVTLPLSVINTLEMSRGRHSNAGKGAETGGVILGMLSLATFGFMASLPKDDFFRLEGGWRDALLLTAGGTAAGAGVGALIGSMSSSEHWQNVPLGSVQVVPISLGRFGVAVSLRF
jgi:hypothetical protein